jgi:hypothetical protein
MRKLLESLGFSIPQDIDRLMGQMNAVQQYRVETGATDTEEVTRTSALAVLLYSSPQIRDALSSFGLQLEGYLESIGLRMPVDYRPAKDVDIYFSLEEALTDYATSKDAVLHASGEVLTLAILEQAVFKIQSKSELYDLEVKLTELKVDVAALSRALELRTLPFDPRQGPVDDENKKQAADSPATGSKSQSIAPFYSDHPAQQDALNRKAVAETIATMIESVWKEDERREAARKVAIKNDDVDRAFVVHLHGRWGSGKTSILNFLTDALLAQNPSPRPSQRGDSKRSPARPWIIVNYNAWRNQHLGPAWWTLTEAVYHQAREQLGGWLDADCRRLMLRDRWWRIRSSYAPYAVLALTAIAVGLWLLGLWRDVLFLQNKDWFVQAFKIIGTIAGLIAAVFAFGHTYSVGSAKTAKSYLELSRDPLSPLTKRYGDLVSDIGRPVAVFVDDLDRCNADFVVELLQSIQTLFRHAKVLYVVAADRDWLCASYQQQYKVFGDSLGEPGKSLGHLFIEKVFQLSVEVPRLSEKERDAYWAKLIQPAEQPSESRAAEITEQLSKEFEAANSEAAIIEIVERYRGDPNRSAIAASKGFQRMHAASLVREREHFLSGYAHLIEANPRAMKRLLNAYGFRRGFDIQSPIRSDPDALVRWTILENRWPILADYLEGRSGGRGETDIIKALTKDSEVLKVAEGLTWEKLRPVPSAPDQPPATDITPGADAKKSQTKPQPA